jgi:hypothetical protein
MKLSVRISHPDWERLRGERTKIRAILRTTLEDLSQEERKAIRKLIESLLKGGEELEEVHEADHAAAKGMMQQVVVILEGLDKPESVATGWVKDFDSAKVKIIGHLVHGLNDYLNADKSEGDSETDSEVSDATAAGGDKSLQGGPPQGDAQTLSAPTSLEGKSGEVTEKDIQGLFEDREGQSGNTGGGAGAPADEKLPSPYLARATSPSLPSAIGPKEQPARHGDTSAPGRTESSSLLDTSCWIPQA